MEPKKESTINKFEYQSLFSRQEIAERTAQNTLFKYILENYG
jgi:hypothetical protein